VNKIKFVKGMQCSVMIHWVLCTSSKQMFNTYIGLMIHMAAFLWGQNSTLLP